MFSYDGHNLIPQMHPGNLLMHKGTIHICDVCDRDRYLQLWTDCVCRFLWCHLWDDMNVSGKRKIYFLSLGREGRAILLTAFAFISI